VPAPTVLGALTTRACLASEHRARRTPTARTNVSGGAAPPRRSRITRHAVPMCPHDAETYPANEHRARRTPVTHTERTPRRGRRRDAANHAPSTPYPRPTDALGAFTHARPSPSPRRQRPRRTLAHRRHPAVNARAERSPIAVTPPSTPTPRARSSRHPAVNAHAARSPHRITPPSTRRTLALSSRGPRLVAHSIFRLPAVDSAARSLFRRLAAHALFRHPAVDSPHTRSSVTPPSTPRTLALSSRRLRHHAPSHATYPQKCGFQASVRRRHSRSAGRIHCIKIRRVVRSSESCSWCRRASRSPR
jgi:hypothetical protein